MIENTTTRNTMNVPQPRFFVSGFGASDADAAMGAPQFGQAAARSLTSRPHSSHLINAMPVLP